MREEKERKQWFVIKSKPHQELTAKRNYGLQGIETYLPLIETTRSHARKKEIVAKPLFPGYLFVHLDSHEQKWETISSTKGAVGPVRFGNTIPVVSDWIIESLHCLENEQHVLQPKKILEKKLVPGSRVSVTLSGKNEIEGIFQCFHGKDRAVILLDLLNRQIKTVTNCSNIVL